MNAPPPSDPQFGDRIADVVEMGAKTAIGLGAIWALVAKVLKPYQVWRRASKAKARKELEAQMREMFAVELSAFKEFSGIPDRLDTLFQDHDLLLEIALDNRERHDETNALLDFLGFASERRTSEDRREEVTKMVTTLADRRKARRRQGDLKPHERPTPDADG